MDVMFTNKDGEQVDVVSFAIPPSEMTSLMRLQEDYQERGEHLSMTGVVLEVLNRGKKAIRHSWTQAEKNANARDFSKQAVRFFNTDGTVRDAEGLAALAVAKGLVKGSPAEV